MNITNIALKVVQYLNCQRYRAIFATDLTGLASRVMMNSRSREGLPDMKANLYPAMLAGLAYPGLHGCPITEKYGVRQRFIAVVTDCPLDNETLYTGNYACEACKKPCISHCPTTALKNKTAELKIEQTTFYIPSVDCFACDWAKRYAMSGKEGPQYYGLKTDIPVPGKREAEEILMAINKIEWGVQKRHANICEECIRICPEKGGKS